MSCFGFVGRTSSSGWSATSCQKPRPGLPGRPAPCRRALPVHEREPGLLPGCRHGARTRRVQGWFLRLAAATAIQPRHRRRGAAETYPDRMCQFAPDLRRTTGPRRSSGSRRAARPQTGCAPDARGRAAGCLPPAWWPNDDAAGQGCPACAEPGGSRLHRLWAGSALGRRYHVCADGGVPLPCRGAGRLEPQDRRLVGPTTCGRSWCWTRWKLRSASADRRTSSITATRAAWADSIGRRDTLEQGGWDGGSASVKSCVAEQAALAGTTSGRAAGAPAAFLGVGGGGGVERGRGDWRGRVGPGRSTVVSEVRRHAAIEACAIIASFVWTVPVVCRAGGACHPAWPRRRGAADRPADGAVGIDDLARAAAQRCHARRRVGLSGHDGAVAR